jgi:hypothetical protein
MKNTPHDSQGFGVAMAKKAATKPREVPLDDVLVDGDDWPSIPDGSYLAQYIHHDTCEVFQTAKVFVHFRIVEPGPFSGVCLYRAFRASGLIGKPGRNGRFRLKKRSELYLTLCWLHEGRKLRPDRVSLRDLRDVMLRVTTRTVFRDYKQRPLPEMLRYSVVDEIQGIEVGSLNKLPNSRHPLPVT